MYVVIAGGGKIGRYIAQDLVAKHHDVTVVERFAERCEQLVAETDVLVIEGDACDVSYLEQARTARADAFVATTHEDDENLVACQLAKVEFGVRRAISRVNSPKNVEIFDRLGIEAVSSTRLISELLENEFSVGELIRLTSLKGGAVNIVEVRLPHEGELEGAHVPGPRPVEALELPAEAVLVAIFRGEETVIPRGTTTIQAGDEVVALATPDHEEQLRAVLLGDAE